MERPATIEVHSQNTPTAATAQNTTNGQLPRSAAAIASAARTTAETALVARAVSAMSR
jgi:hypothetical protein